MTANGDRGFGYRISRTASGWLWVAFDVQGQVQDRGLAPNKALAAACVIRTIARNAVPAAEVASKAA
jgi:hypothetical protein